MRSSASNPDRRCETASAVGVVERARSVVRAQRKAPVGKVTGVRGVGVTDRAGAVVKEVGDQDVPDPNPDKINDRRDRSVRRETQIARGRPAGQAAIEIGIGKPATIKDVPRHHERERQG